jgi:uncharacterized membrane protein
MDQSGITQQLGLILLALFAVILISGFGHEADGKQIKQVLRAGENTPSFFNDVYPILFTKCGGTECHGPDSRAAARYNTYKNVYAYRKKIKKRIDTKIEPMPPIDKPQLTAKEKKLILDWIEAGAPNN